MAVSIADEAGQPASFLIVDQPNGKAIHGSITRDSIRRPDTMNYQAYHNSQYSNDCIARGALEAFSSRTSLGVAARSSLPGQHSRAQMESFKCVTALSPQRNDARVHRATICCFKRLMGSDTKSVL